MAVEVFLPKMTDHMDAGEIVRWLVSEGATVAEHEPILEMMTDKVVAEVESPASGVLKGIRAGVEPGALVAVGEPIAFIAAPGEVVPQLTPLSLAGRGAGGEGRPVESVPQAPLPSGEGGSQIESGPVRATPAARAVARELGVDLALVAGSGPNGRVSEADVRAFVPAGFPFPSGEGSEGVRSDLDLTPIQRATGRRMLESVQTAPQFSLSIDVDASRLLAIRAAVPETERPAITALLVRLVAESLVAHPRLNASLVDGRLRLAAEANVGVAVGGEDELHVPVVRAARAKTPLAISQEIATFRARAAAGQLSAADQSGGTFTVSNLGMYGVDRFTAILNPPEGAILAVGRIARRAVAIDADAIAVRPILTLTLTVDHRVADGRQAARFLADLRQRIEEG